MANFNPAYQFTNKVEGGYDNDPDDHGSETALGISRKFWPGWSGWKLIDAYKAKYGIQDIDHYLFTDPDILAARQSFYLANFWNPLKLSEINDQQVAGAVYDFGVNAGTGISARLLQQACAKNGHQLSIDGKIGLATLTAANATDPKQLLTDFNQLREDYYNHIIQHDPTQAKFKASWFSRIKPYVA